MVAKKTKTSAEVVELDDKPTVDEKPMEEKKPRSSRRSRAVAAVTEQKTEVKEPEVNEPVVEEDTINEEDGVIYGDGLSVDYVDESEYDPADMQFDAEYGYRKAKMTAENLNMSRDRLFIKRAIRSSDLGFQFVAGSRRSINEAFIRNPNQYFLNEGEEGFENVNPKKVIWKSLGLMALGTYNYGYDCYRWLTNDDKIIWSDGWEYGRGKSRGIRRRPGSMAAAKQSEKNAISLINRALNIGDSVDLFLPHSGFSVVIRSPSISQFIATERKIIGDRLEIFRDLRGHLLSQDSGYIQQAVFDLFCSCVESTSLGTVDKDILMENISILDILDIAWALACCKFPNGYILSQSCLANPGTCNTVTTEVVNPREMYRVIRDRLSPKQKEMAANLSSPITVDDAMDYVNEFDYGEDGHVELTTYDTDVNIVINFGMPSIGHQFRTMESWRASVEDSANSAFAMPLVGDIRSRYMKEQIEAMKALKYRAYVESVTITNDEGERVTVDSDQAIADVLAGISGNQYNLNKFLLGVEKFINRATVSLVGLPNAKCPGCGGFHETDDEDQVGRYLIPMNVLSFFTMLCHQLTPPSADSAEETQSTQQS